MSVYRAKEEGDGEETSDFELHYLLKRESRELAPEIRPHPLSSLARTRR